MSNSTAHPHIPANKVKLLVSAFQVLSVILILTTIATWPREPEMTINAQASFHPPSQTSSPPTVKAPPVPVIKANAFSAPQLTAKAVVVLDPVSLKTIFQLNPDQQLLPASTTKLMTALVALETYELSDTVTITQEEKSVGQSINLKQGELISVENLLYGLLIASGNDAALALATSYPVTGYSGFVDAMNRKAKELRMSNTNYTNVSGVESNHHYTSARDLASLSLEVMRHDQLMQMAGTKEKTIESADGQIKHHLKTTNQLLSLNPYVTGLKTGWTPNALECLVTSVNKEGKQLLIVLLGSQSRFTETNMIIDWVYQNFDWVEITDLVDQ